MKLLTKKEVGILYKIINEKAVPWDQSIVGGITKGIFSGLSFITGKIDAKIKSQRIQSLLLQWGAEYIAAIDKVYREKIENVDSFDENDGTENKSDNDDDIISKGEERIKKADDSIETAENINDDSDIEDNYEVLASLMTNLKSMMRKRLPIGRRLNIARILRLFLSN